MKAMVSLLRHTLKWTPKSERGKHEIQESLLGGGDTLQTYTSSVCVCVHNVQHWVD